MIVTVKDKTQQIVVPPKLKRLAGIKPGAGRTITITASGPECTPSAEELAAVQLGESEIAEGEFVSIGGLLNALGDKNRKSALRKAKKLCPKARRRE